MEDLPKEENEEGIKGFKIVNLKQQNTTQLKFSGCCSLCCCCCCDFG